MQSLFSQNSAASELPLQLSRPGHSRRRQRHSVFANLLRVGVRISLSCACFCRTMAKFHVHMCACRAIPVSFTESSRVIDLIGLKDVPSSVMVHRKLMFLDVVTLRGNGIHLHALQFDTKHDECDSDLSCDCCCCCWPRLLVGVDCCFVLKFGFVSFMLV